MTKYEYMIVYQHENGYGRAFVETNFKINSYEDLDRMDKEIEKETGDESVIITDFKLLRTYESEDK